MLYIDDRAYKFGCCINNITAVSQYESDKNDIAASRLSELAKVLDTSADYLLTGKEMGLDADEMELITVFRNLKGNSKEIAIQQIKILQSFL